MLDHPISVLGWLIATVGFLMLSAWVRTDIPANSSGGQATQVFNAHKAALNSAIVFVGLVMVIGGTIVRGSDRVISTRSVTATTGDFTTKAATDRYAKPVAQSQFNIDAEDIFKTGVLTIKVRQGNEREMTVACSGMVVMQSINGAKTFSPVADAKANLA